MKNKLLGSSLFILSLTLFQTPADYLEEASDTLFFSHGADHTVSSTTLLSAGVRISSENRSIIFGKE